jgi:hypothetical protein
VHAADEPAASGENNLGARGLSVHGDLQAVSALRLIETREPLITAARVLSPAAILLRVEGETSMLITIDGGDLAKATAPLAFANGATDRAVRLRG